MANAKQNSVWDKVGEWIQSLREPDPDAGLTQEQKNANAKKLAPRGTYYPDQQPTTGTPRFVKPDDGSGY